MKNISETLVNRADELLAETQKSVGLYNRLDGIAYALNRVTKTLQRREEGKYRTLSEEEKTDFFLAVNAAADAFTAATGVMDSILSLRKSISRFGSKLTETIHDFNVRLSWAGGKVPYEPLCEYSSGEFANDCCDIRGRTKLMRLKKAVKVLEKLKDTRVNIHSKYRKLQDRLPRAGSPGEKAAAKNLVEKMKETEAMLDRRVLIVTAFFYKERLGMLTEVAEATREVAAAAENARDMSVRYDAKHVLNDILDLDLKVRKEFK